jgi:hypothetical protein
MGCWGGGGAVGGAGPEAGSSPRIRTSASTRGHGDRCNPDAVPEPKPGHGVGEDKATNDVCCKEEVYESLRRPARVCPRVGPRHQRCQEAHPVGHHHKEGEVQELDRPLGDCTGGGGRGTEEEDALTEEGLVTHHHCLGMGVVNEPGGNADGKEVSRARSGG